MRMIEGRFYTRGHGVLKASRIDALIDSPADWREVAECLDERTGRIEGVTINRQEDLYPESRPQPFTSKIYLEFAEVKMKEMLELIKSKNADYTNGAGPFANFDQASDFGVDPLVGLMIRMNDKMQRVKSYCKQGELQVKGEGIEDCFKDFIGYSLIALAMLDEKKRGAR